MTLTEVKFVCQLFLSRTCQWSSIVAFSFSNTNVYRIF